MHEKWMEKPAYREAHEALEEEFALAAAVIDARLRLPRAEISEIRRWRGCNGRRSWNAMAGVKPCPP